jgi:hypothetical protein
MTKTQMIKHVEKLMNEAVKKQKELTKYEMHERITTIDGYQQLSKVIKEASLYCDAIIDGMPKLLSKHNLKARYTHDLLRTLKRANEDLPYQLLYGFGYDDGTQEIYEQFGRILGNLKGMTAKQAETYLQSLGFELPQETPKKQEILAPVDMNVLSKYIKKEV